MGLELDMVVVVDPAATPAVPLGERLLYICVDPLDNSSGRDLPKILGGPDYTKIAEQPNEPPYRSRQALASCSLATTG